jgi:hypothetical protein
MPNPTLSDLGGNCSLTTFFRQQGCRVDSYDVGTNRSHKWGLETGRYRYRHVHLRCHVQATEGLVQYSSVAIVEVKNSRLGGAKHTPSVQHKAR